jgi:hypothetical protein
LDIKTAKQRLMTNSWFSSRVVAIKSLNVMIAKIMKVRPQDPASKFLYPRCEEKSRWTHWNYIHLKSRRISKPEKYWNPIFVSPKCGKRLGYARYRIQVQGLEFEVGAKFLLRQLTGLLIRRKCQAC